MECPKCNGLFEPPVYHSEYRGWWFNMKLVEWLKYRCFVCGYILRIKCKDSN